MSFRVSLFSPKIDETQSRLAVSSIIRLGNIRIIISYTAHVIRTHHFAAHILPRRVSVHPHVGRMEKERGFRSI